MKYIYQHIIFATDFSEVNIKMQSKLEKLALLHEAKLSVIHVISGLESFAFNHELTVNLKETLELQSKERLFEFCQDLKIPTSNQFIKSGEVVTSILSTMSEINADLLVVGSYGQSGFVKSLGSITRKLISKTDRDILVLKK